MASTYDIGIEGMDGIDMLAGCLGTPGLEGYPGVVLKNFVQHASGYRSDVILTDLLEQC
jgi:hypothetical protein